METIPLLLCFLLRQSSMYCSQSCKKISAVINWLAITHFKMNDKQPSPSPSHPPLFSSPTSLLSSLTFPPILQGQPSLHCGIAKRYSAAKPLSAIKHPTSLLYFLFFCLVPISQFFVCDTELCKQSAGCATWCRVGGQSAC